VSAKGKPSSWKKIEAETGVTISFERILLVADGDKINIGAPVVAGAVVTAEIIAQGRHKKVKIMKFKRRKHHMKQMGHRQWFTEVKITGIQA